MATKIVLGILMVLLLGIFSVACGTSQAAENPMPATKHESVLAVAPVQAQQSSLYEDEWLNLLGKGMPRNLLPQDPDEVAVLAAITLDHILIAESNFSDAKLTTEIWECLAQAEQKARGSTSAPWSSIGGHWSVEHFRLKKLGVKVENPTIKHFTFLFTFPEIKDTIKMKAFQDKVTITIQSDNGKRMITNVSC